MRRFAALVLGVVATAAHGQVYKCEEGGRAVYQNAPSRGAGAPLQMNTVGEEIERRKRVREEAAADQQACQEKFRGKPAVKNSPWDGSVWAVEEYMKGRVLKDPDSFKAVQWGPVVRGCGEYAVRLTYRARNSFGGYVVETRDFLLNADGVVVGSAPGR